MGRKTGERAVVTKRSGRKTCGEVRFKSITPLHSLNWSRLQPGRPQEHRGDSSWFSGNVDFSKMMKRGCNQAPDPLRLTTPHGSRFSLTPRHLHKLFPRVRIWGMVVLAHNQDQVALVA